MIHHFDQEGIGIELIQVHGAAWSRSGLKHGALPGVLKNSGFGAADSLNTLI